MANNQITNSFGLKHLNSADANNVRSFGTFFCAAFSNTPSPVGWLISCPQTDGSYYYFQLFIGVSENSLYIRRLNGSVISDWTKLGG